MTDVVLFHHVLGLTEGVLDLADRLRAGGHTVHTPDLFGGRRADTVEDGMTLARSVGEDVVRVVADEAVADLPPRTVFAGISYGVQQAQRLAQTRAGAAGCLLYEGCLPVTGEWAVGPWPAGVPVQVHGMDADPVFAFDGDLEAARELVELAHPGTAELFTYPGDAHLFTDDSLPHFDAAATDLVVQRSLELLDRLG